MVSIDPPSSQGAGNRNCCNCHNETKHMEIATDPGAVTTRVVVIKEGSKPRALDRAEAVIQLVDADEGIVSEPENRCRAREHYSRSPEMVSVDGDRWLPIHDY